MHPVAIDIPDDLVQLANRQYGLVSYRQVAPWLGPTEVRRLRSQGVLLAFGPAVYRFAGAPGSWRQRAMGPCVGYGDPVAVSHLAAARLLGWDDAGHPPVEVTVPPGRSGRRPDARTHRAVLDPGDVVDCFGLPTTAPTRTLLDLATTLPHGRLERLFDHLLLRRDLRAEAVMSRLPALAEGDRHPLHDLWVLAGRRVGQPTTGESVWEDRIAGWLVEGGLPAPVRQHEVTVRGATFRLDLAYPEWLVAVEFDGWAWHRSRRSFDHDRARLTELSLAGWLVVTVTSAHDRLATVGRVGRALSGRGWGPRRGDG
jgi:Arc/MetJ family transcription regulator